jgi:hypothetical protein
MNLEEIKKQQQQKGKRINESPKRVHESKRSKTEQVTTNRIVYENTLLLEQLSTDFDTLTGSKQDFQRIYNEASEKLKKENWIEQVHTYFNVGMPRM